MAEGGRDLDLQGALETREVDWSDAHPLNHSATHDDAYRELFSVRGEERGT